MEARVGLKKTASVTLALAIWQTAAMLLGNSLLLVTPLTVVKKLVFLVSEPGFLSSVGFSFLRIVSGFLLALVTGCLVAVIAGRYSFAETILWPYIAVIKSVPVASFIILCLIWLSSKSLSVFISFLIVLPIIYQNTLQGIKSTDKKLLEMAEVFRIGPLRRLKYIHIPNLKPYLISACSVSIGMSWKAGIAAEVIGIPDGSIGERLYEAKIYLSSGDLFAWTAVIVAVSIAFEKLFLFLLKKTYVLLEKS